MMKKKSRARTMSEALQIASSQQNLQPSHGTQPSQPTQPSQSTQPSQTSYDSVSQTSTAQTKRSGRGCAKGIKKWGTGDKLHVMFDDNFQPLHEEGTKLKGQLGTIVRNPHRVPLTYLNWDAVPEDVKSAIWKEIEDNVEDCPQAFQPVAMHTCQKMWKDHKSKIKRTYYTKNKDDPNILLKVPNKVLPDQWKELVQYWESCDVKKNAETASENRGFRSAIHRTGRTHFSQIRHELSCLGERTDKMSLFIKTRDKNDPEVLEILEAFNQQLSEIPEPLQTNEVRDSIFHKVLGKDGHGYCKTYGTGVPRSAVYGQSAGTSKASSSSLASEITRQVNEAYQEMEQRLTIEIEQRLTQEIKQKLTEEIEQKVTDKIMAQLERMGARMDLFVSQEGTNGSRQDAGSSHRIIRESVGDAIQIGDEQVGCPLSTPPCSDKQVGQKVCLVTHSIPKDDVAEGILISTDPFQKVNGEALGTEFWEVLVKKVIIPNACLERPQKDAHTIGEVVGHSVAWRVCNVMFDEV